MCALLVGMASTCTHHLHPRTLASAKCSDDRRFRNTHSISKRYGKQWRPDRNNRSMYIISNPPRITVIKPLDTAVNCCSTYPGVLRFSPVIDITLPSQPTLFLGLNYMILGRLAATFGPDVASKTLFIAPSRIATIFVCSDVVTFFIQVIGAALLANRSSVSRNTLGTNVRALPSLSSEWIYHLELDSSFSSPVLLCS